MSNVTKEMALDYHKGDRPGKIETIPTKPYSSQRDLSLAYSPGVAYPCLEIEKNPQDAYEYTNKGNLVAVISNGTAVLGLGNIGAQAGKPVMEGKALLFKIFAGLDCFDIEVDEKDPKKFIEIVKSLAPTFGGINLEDIKAPECFEIEQTLKAECDIPVMHDDQHGTAIISGAGLLNALEVQGKKIEDIKLVVNGAGCVSDDMRERVAEAMRALNYVPNELARNLYHDRTNTVGVIVPTIRHPFFATLAAGLQRELSERGLRTMLCSTADSGTGEAEYVDMLRRHMMDGIVMAAHTEHAPDYWTSIGRPIVGFDCYLGEGIPSVGSDHEQGGRLIADLLIHNGSRHVAMVGGPCRQFHDLAQTRLARCGRRNRPGTPRSDRALLPDAGA